MTAPMPKMTENAHATTKHTAIEFEIPHRRSSRTAGARTNDRMTASASGTSTTWPKYSASTMMKPTTASSMAEPGMAGEAIGVLTAADAMYFVLDMNLLAPA